MCASVVCVCVCVCVCFVCITADTNVKKLALLQDSKKPVSVMLHQVLSTAANTPSSSPKMDLYAKALTSLLGVCVCVCVYSSIYPSVHPFVCVCVCVYVVLPKYENEILTVVDQVLNETQRVKKKFLLSFFSA